MKVYIAGPMRGIAEFNFPAFIAVGLTCEELGWRVFNPAMHDLEIDPEIVNAPGYVTGDTAALPGFDIHAAMQWDLERVLEADAIVLLPGWEQSSGARYERAVADATGKRIFRARLDRDRWEVTEDARREQKVSTAVESGETRVVNPITGGEKGSKDARFDLIPARPLELLAEHYGRGARKYADRNWERGYNWSLSFAAMMRHAWAFWRGDDIDPETNSPHLVAVAWHAFALLEFARTKSTLDDRAKEATS